MSYLSMMEAKLPPGFRFHPRDDELVNDYLAKRLSGDSNVFPMMIDVDLNKCEPWDLPESACVGGKEWYFFSLRDRKYATGQRTNRATVSGYWKATGKDRQVHDTRRHPRGVLVGMRKTLVFYQGRAPKGKKTDWVMHEFRMEGPTINTEAARFSSSKEDWVLCRVFFKSRTLSSKTSIENCCDDTGSSSLPPLTDTIISFEQPPFNNLEGYEQVPCFSNLPLNHHPSHRQTPTLAPEVNFPMISKSSTQFGGTSPADHLGSYLNPFPCDKKAIKTFLDQLTRLEGNMKTPNLAEGSSESFLTETGVPSMWNPF